MRIDMEVPLTQSEVVVLGDILTIIVLLELTLQTDAFTETP